MFLNGTIRIGAAPEMVRAALADPGLIARWIDGPIQLQPAADGLFPGRYGPDDFQLRLADSPDGGTLLSFDADATEAGEGELRSWLEHVLTAVKAGVEAEVQAAVPGLPGWLWIGALVLLVMACVALLLWQGQPA